MTSKRASSKQSEQKTGSQQQQLKLQQQQANNLKEGQQQLKRKVAASRKQRGPGKQQATMQQQNLEEEHQNVEPKRELLERNVHEDDEDEEADADDKCNISGKLVESHASGENVCAACLKPIKERYLLVALDKQWHEDCLKCACCDCRLGEVGSSLFHQADKIFCRRDFLRIFGQHGHCAACNKSIPPYEMVMRANENVYHMDCFACQHCQYRFCVGDRFHLTHAHRILCLLCLSESTAASTTPQQRHQAPSTQLRDSTGTSYHAHHQSPPPPTSGSEPASTFATGLTQRPPQS